MDFNRKKNKSGLETTGEQTMQINSITNSQQRTQHNQQAFGAFVISQPLAELMPLIKRAQAVKIDIFTPGDVVDAIKKDGVLGRLVMPPEAEQMFRNVTNGFLFNKGEKAKLLEEADCGFTNVHIEVQNMITNAVPLPIKTLETATTQIERESKTVERTSAELRELEAKLQEKRFLHDTAAIIISEEQAKLKKLGL